MRHYHMACSMALCVWLISHVNAAFGAVSIRLPANSPMTYKVYEGDSLTLNWVIENSSTTNPIVLAAATDTGKQVRANPAQFVGGDQGNRILSNAVTNSAMLAGRSIAALGSVTAVNVIGTGDTRVPRPLAANTGSWKVSISASYSELGGAFQDIKSSLVQIDILDLIQGTSFTGGTTSNYNGTTTGFSEGSFDTPAYQTLGWSFTLSQERLVNSLGFWDEGANGIQSHRVGLWNATTGDLITQTTVTSSSIAYEADEPAGQWLFERLTHRVLLAPGTYVVGAQYAPSSPDAYRYGTATTPITIGNPDPAISYLASRYINSPISWGNFLEFPDSVSTNQQGFFGPNLLLQTVPEPSSRLVLGTVMATLAIARTGRGRQRTRA